MKFTSKLVDLNLIGKKGWFKAEEPYCCRTSITKWSKIIEQMEDQVAAILQEEREEKALRKAEMEATKAENMIAHKEEIFSRPKRRWSVTEKEKKLAAKAARFRVSWSGKEVCNLF